MGVGIGNGSEPLVSGTARERPMGWGTGRGSQAKVREESNTEVQIGSRKCLYFSSGREDKQTLFEPSGQLCELSSTERVCGGRVRLEIKIILGPDPATALQHESHWTCRPLCRNDHLHETTCISKPRGAAYLGSQEDLQLVTQAPEKGFP